MYRYIYIVILFIKYIIDKRKNVCIHTNENLVRNKNPNIMRFNFNSHKFMDST